MGTCDHNGCGHSCHDNCCHQSSCHSKSCNDSCKCSCHGQNGHEQNEHIAYFLEIADCAWEEVLKEKIKEHIRSTQNEHLTEIARVVSEANTQRWKHKMEKKKACCDFKDKLGSCFCSKCSK